MFLNTLSEDKKELFLDLAIQAALANNVIEEEEKEIIFQYSLEMNIPTRYQSIMTLDSLMTELENKLSKIEKKQILFEIIALLFSDGVYDHAEKAFANKLVAAFGFDDDILKEVESLVIKVNAVYKDIYSFVNK